jgi:hypothetical protein
MSARGLAFAALMTIAPLALHAQEIGENVELAGTFGLVGGWVPLSVNGVDHVTPYGGGRIDGGIQLEHVLFGAAIRYWEMQQGDTFGGGGQEFSLVAEWRARRASPLSLRFSYGFDHNTIDRGGGPDRPEVVADGATGYVGIGYEFRAPSDALLQVTADVWLPRGNGTAITMRQPALEIGVGYRGRKFQAIRPIPSGRR